MKLRLQIISIKLAISAIIISNILMADSVMDVILFLIGIGFSSLFFFYQSNK